MTRGPRSRWSRTRVRRGRRARRRRISLQRLTAACSTGRDHRNQVVPYPLSLRARAVLWQLRASRTGLGAEAFGVGRRHALRETRSGSVRRDSCPPCPVPSSRRECFFKSNGGSRAEKHSLKSDKLLARIRWKHLCFIPWSQYVPLNRRCTTHRLVAVMVCRSQ